ncbi:hypothetical protein [Nostoc sp. CHAB 5715]|nr:hypothetical protein [Nostoc sp. CHAB 5715]
MNCGFSHGAGVATVVLWWGLDNQRSQLLGGRAIALLPKTQSG